jgi:hypothetical protein
MTQGLRSRHSMVQDDAMPKRQPPAADDPDRLVRQKAGGHRTADERFDVQGSASRWFLTDQQQTDELGQPLIHGPYANLDELKASLPDARRQPAKGAPRLRVITGTGDAAPETAHASGRKGAATPRAPLAPAAEPAKTWLDELPAADARRMRAMIRALEREGVDRAEQLVHRDRDGLLPAVATQLIEWRLEALVAELPKAERSAARATIQRVVEILTVDGTHVAAPLPRWLLVEVGPEAEPKNRRIKPTISDGRGRG